MYKQSHFSSDPKLCRALYKANIKAKKVNVILTQNNQLEGSHHVTEQNKKTEGRRPEATGTCSERSVMELS